MGFGWADVLIATAAGSVVACLATPPMAWLARRLGLLDRSPGRAIALLGGCAVAAGTLVGVLPYLRHGGGLQIAGLSALALGALVTVAAGLLDDRSGLSPGRKFIWQLSATAGAGLCLAWLGVHLDLFLHWPPLPIMLLTVVWVVAITNAVNFLDNMDGLCAGLGAIAALSLAAINMRSGERTVAVVAAALGGACLGFLPYNWPHARIFLGDTGSMLIGFLLAALSVMGVYTRGAQVPVFAVFTPLFVLGVPVLDCALVVLLRLHARHPPWIGDRRHISHRLVHRGMHPAAAVATLWAAGAMCGLAGVLLPTVGAAEAPLLLALILCALGALAAAAGTRGLSSYSNDGRHS
jgi:UDP-GlcNAc:undecaprenyl-phosphate GlcNAc-1-phosphate transferase